MHNCILWCPGLRKWYLCIVIWIYCINVTLCIKSEITFSVIFFILTFKTFTNHHLVFGSMIGLKWFHKYMKINVLLKSTSACWSKWNHACHNILHYDHIYHVLRHNRSLSYHYDHTTRTKKHCLNHTGDKCCHYNIICDYSSLEKGCYG